MAEDIDDFEDQIRKLANEARDNVDGKRYAPAERRGNLPVYEDQKRQKPVTHATPHRVQDDLAAYDEELEGLTIAQKIFAVKLLLDSLEYEAFCEECDKMDAISQELKLSTRDTLHRWARTWRDDLADPAKEIETTEG